MTIVYTICTISYSSQAYLLAQTLLKHNSDCKFVIGLVGGGKNHLEAIFPKSVDIIEVKDLQILVFNEMQARYKIYELCFSLKPYTALYLLNEYKNCDKILYLDSDIYVFSSFNIILQQLDNCSILLSSHSNSPYKKHTKAERGILTGGNFNAGFIAIRRTNESIAFLQWWAEKLVNECLGLVGDQVWLNLVPLYFADVMIERNIGVNLGHWKLHEINTINLQSGCIYINNTPLIFYHYSAFDYYINNNISNHSLYKRNDFKNLDCILNEISNKLLAVENRSAFKTLLINKRYSGINGKSKFLLKKF
jgi:hypothetical protein